MIGYTIPYYAILCYALLYHTLLYYTILYYTILHYANAIIYSQYIPILHAILLRTSGPSERLCSSGSRAWRRP